MNYNELSNEMKAFLNKAMDVYFAIKDKEIKKIVEKRGKKINYEFTKLDKKVLSFFIAGFLADVNLKDIFSQYDDIKLNNLFDFISITENDINPIADEKYEEFYEKNLKLELISIIKKGCSRKEINFITPGLVISSLEIIRLHGSEVLDFFAKNYNVARGLFGFDEHPIFSALNNYNLMNGCISDSSSSKRNNLGLGDSKSAASPLKKGIFTSTADPQINQRIIKVGDSVWEILDEIKKKFIGQEGTVEGLFYNIVYNQQLAEMDDIPDGQRSIIFIDGPTGTGKTAITREITKRLGIPFIATAVTNYSSTGYRGGEITDILKGLYQKADGDLELAERGIVVLDEFDKIAYSRVDGLEMKKAVQQELLDFMGGGKYNIQFEKKISDTSEIEFDTSKLTFACLGALTDVRSNKTEKKQSIGFGQVRQLYENQDYNITPHDLMDIGLERELVGRINTYLHTDDYSKGCLEKILRESTISPLIGFKMWVESRGKKLIIDDEVYGLIAEQAYELNTGARSLQTVMNNIRTPFIKEVLRGTSDTIHLDSETVIKINSQITNRKGRG